ncbi:hypothetical protein Tco_1207618 [Tanacetum coccineum]
MERFMPMDTEKESRKRTGVELQTESSKKLKSDTREDVSVPKEKDKESVKREEKFKIKKPVLRYTKRKSLARKGRLQKKPESAKSSTEEDVEAYMEESVDEPSSEEFPMGSIPQGSAPAKIIKWQIIKTGKRGVYQIIREDNTDVSTMSNRHKDWLVQEQTVLSWLAHKVMACDKGCGKSIYMVDSLPKTGWYSTYQ